MLYIKDGVIQSATQIRALYPQVSMSEDAFVDLGWVEYVPPPPTPEQVAAAAAFAAQMADETAAADDAKSNATVRFLRNNTPAAVRAKIAADVTNLATAVQMLQHFGTVLCVLTKRNLR